MAYLEVEGDKRIYYEHHRGSGPPVVLVHAWGMSGRMWDHTVAELRADGREVVVIDCRGCSRSDKDFEDLSIAVQGADVAKLCDTLGLTKPVLNGWSAGGAIVTEGAARLGDKLGGLVLTVGASPRWAAADDFPEGNPIENAEATLTGLKTARADTAWAVSDAICHQEISEIVRHWMYEMFMETSPRADETLADLAHNVDLRGTLPDITAPALVFGGRHDVFVPFAIAERAVELLPDAKLVACEESGHAPPLEEPELYMSELRSFLDRVGA
jgi:pimeloyl-ACP methyl ester carboxylesterase